MYTRVHNRYINRIDINTNDLYERRKKISQETRKNKGLMSKSRDVCTTIEHTPRRHPHIQVKSKTLGV